MLTDFSSVLCDLPAATAGQTWYVAYSGGLDSTVLLHCLWQQKLPVHAIHINHQLHPSAADWAEHCAAQCRQWHIPFTLKKVNVQNSNGESLEAAARAARYTGFKECISTNSVLCTAHHQDDQAETLLLQLMRGSGVAGMAAMPFCTAFAEGFLIRPFLKVSREALKQYALQHQLHWIEDPSNAEDKFDRNYLRQQIMPLLKQRWPAAAQTIARSATHCAEALHLLHEHTALDYQQVLDNNELRLSQLNKLSAARQRQVIRFWLTEKNLPLPTTAQLQQVQEELLISREDAQPVVQWADISLQRYRDKLYVQQTAEKMDLTQSVLPWDFTQPLVLPGDLGTLIARQEKGQGISMARLANKPVSIQFRRGAERCRPVERAHSQTLKNLLQEYAIPPWQRDTLPLLYCGDEIAAVIGQWVCADYAADKEETGWIISFSPLSSALVAGERGEKASDA